MLPPILPQIAAPCLLLRPTLGSVLDPLVLLLNLLAPLNSNLFFVFSKTLLHMMLTYKCPKLWNVQISWYYFLSSHFEDDDECDNNLIANGWIFNIPTLSLLLNIYSFHFFNTSLFVFSFISMFESLCFLFLCYSLQIFYCAIFIHFSSNTITSRKHTILCKKWKRLVIVTLFIFVHQLLACLVFFWLPIVF